MRVPQDFIGALRVLVEAMDRAAAWRSGVTVLLIVGGSLLAGLAPLALKGMVDALAGPSGSRHANLAIIGMTFAALYLGALCASRLLTELRPVLMSAAEQRLYARMRERFYGHLLSLPLAFHLGRQTGALVHALQQSIAGYQIIVFALVNSVVPILIELATVILVLASLGQPALIATFLGSALAYLLVLSLGTSQLKTSAHAVSAASLDTHGVLADGLLNVEAIKCFTAEAVARDRFSSACETLACTWTRLLQLRARVGLMLVAIFVLSVTASLALALRSVAHGTLSIGGFILANVYMLQVVRPLEMLGAATRDLSQALAFIRPMLDVLRRSPEASDRSAGLSGESADAGSHGRPVVDNAATFWRQAPRIVFRDVRFAYADGKPVLHSLSLDIAAGRTVGIVGASGSGKSSLVRLLLRLVEPQAGSILLEDVGIDTLPMDILRSAIAVVPQDTVLFNDTIAFNIGVGKVGAQRSDIEEAARVACLHDFISSLPGGYDTLVGERGLRLSGGERQRLAIARAVLKSPLIYVLDEATSMLDSRTETAMLGGLKEVSAGCTTITIAHRLSTVRHADEIVVLENGGVVERGDHDTLLARAGAYARLWHATAR